MLRTVARLALLVLALVCAGCGGGGGGEHADHSGSEAFPDVLEIARAELGDDAVLVSVRVSETAISFSRVQFGRTTRVTYNAAGVFTGNARVPNPRSSTQTFRMAEIVAGAPAKLLAAIQEGASGTVTGFEATLARDRRGALMWHAKANVDGAAKEYEAAADGTLTG